MHNLVFLVFRTLLEPLISFLPISSFLTLGRQMTAVQFEQLYEVLNHQSFLTQPGLCKSICLCLRFWRKCISCKNETFLFDMCNMDMTIFLGLGVLSNKYILDVLYLKKNYFWIKYLRTQGRWLFVGVCMVEGVGWGGSWGWERGLLCISPIAIPPGLLYTSQQGGGATIENVVIAFSLFLLPLASSDTIMNKTWLDISKLLLYCLGFF